MQQLSAHSSHSPVKSRPSSSSCDNCCSTTSVHTHTHPISPTDNRNGGEFLCRICDQCVMETEHIVCVVCGQLACLTADSLACSSCIHFPNNFQCSVCASRLRRTNTEISLWYCEQCTETHCKACWRRAFRMNPEIASKVADSPDKCPWCFLQS